jgi:hypothetical protein
VRKINKRIAAVLDPLRDENGIINPTRFQFADQNRSLIYDEARQSRLPIRFVVEEKPGQPAHCHLTIEGGWEGELDSFVFRCIYYQIMGSPLIDFCNVGKRYIAINRQELVITERDNLAIKKEHAPLPDRGCLTLHQPYDLTPSGWYWKDKMIALKKEREKRNSLRRLWRAGLLPRLHDLTIDATGYELTFEYHGVKEGYCIFLATQYETRPASSSKSYELYKGFDRALFLRLFAEIMRSDYRRDAACLWCLDVGIYQRVYLRCGVHKNLQNKIDETEPYHTWLAEATA